MAIPNLDDLGNQALGTATSIVSGKAGYEEWLKWTAAVKGADVVLGLFGESTKGARKNLDGLSQAFSSLYAPTTNEKVALEALSKAIEGDLGGALKGVMGALKTATNGAQDFIKTITQLGQDKSFVNSIRDQAYQLSTLGISYGQLKAANIALIESYNASIRISDDQGKKFEDNRKAMSQLITFNDKFGVSTQQTTQLLNFTKNTMGGGTEQAIKFSEQLEKFADVTGQKTGKVFSDFNSSLDRFSVLTADKAISQFERLQATAARTGLDMGKLFDAVKQFDDIESGFEKGGQLNRILSFMGGSFDTFAAMQADDDERARMIMEALGGVSDNFAKLGTDQAKRSMVAQLQQALPGFDTKTITGILNKSTDLSKDIADIAKMPLEKDMFTDRERVQKLTDLSTSADFGKVKDDMLEASKAAQTLANNLKISERSRAAMFTEASKLLDDRVLSPIVNANVAGVKNALSDFKKEASAQLTAALSNPAQQLSSAGANFVTAVQSFHDAIKGKPVSGINYSLPDESAISVTPAQKSYIRGY